MKVLIRTNVFTEPVITGKFLGYGRDNIPVVKIWEDEYMCFGFVVEFTEEIKKKLSGLPHKEQYEMLQKMQAEKNKEVHFL
ncbi:MAG: hypothetical protein PHX25_02290 [Candidatus Pacebacteria bacterium]|nr:hypothetical protein [Candidatus Paceibacterota bacterium]